MNDTNNESHSNRSSQIGLSIGLLRELAGYTQADLARRIQEKLQISPAGVSRIESGDREVSADELATIVASIGTQEAKDFLEFHNGQWHCLKKPDFQHPDSNILRMIDRILHEVAVLFKNPELKAAYRAQIERYEGQLRKLAGQIERRDHPIAMIGSIGVGKSTAICRTTGLEIESKKGELEPALEVGGGGITICEVHIKQGPGFGIIVEPRSHEEITADVSDFCDDLINEIEDSQLNDPEPESLGLSKEVKRAIRNMAGLPVRRTKNSEGKTEREDLAKGLAKKVGERKELLVQILAKMELARRDRRDIWYPAGSGLDPLIWLQKSFASINNGRHLEFAIPRRMEVIMPDPPLRKSETSSLNFEVAIVDTKGIDQTAGRPDLECHFDDPRTIVVLCSMFNDAPQTAIQQLLERARDSGAMNVENKAAIMVFPRPGEALAMKDDSGLSVEDDLEGYELKQEQVEMRLRQIGLSLPVAFFNAQQDSFSAFQSFLLKQVERLRQHYREDATQLINTIQHSIANRDKEEYLAVLRKAGKRLKVWLDTNRDLGTIPQETQEVLLGTMRRAYASTIRASIRRNGAWPNLDYGHQLGFGARKIAATIVGKRSDEFDVIARNLLDDPEFADAHNFIRQTSQFLANATDELLKAIHEAGRSAFAQELRNSTLWTECEGEWGQGPGYRDRVTKLNAEWFSDPKAAEARAFILKQIEKGWNAITNELEQMLTTEVGLD